MRLASVFRERFWAHGVRLEVRVEHGRSWLLAGELSVWLVWVGLLNPNTGFWERKAWNVAPAPSSPWGQPLCRPKLGPFPPWGGSFWNEPGFSACLAPASAPPGPDLSDMWGLLPTNWVTARGSS